jgi:hypothetical protein
MAGGSVCDEPNHFIKECLSMLGKPFTTNRILKVLTLILFTFFASFVLYRTLVILRTSNAILLTEALHTSPGFIISVTGYNEFKIIFLPIMIGFASALVAVKLSHREQK